MRIGVFAYDFPHGKTQAGLFNLCLSGNRPAVVLGAKAVELKFYQSKMRIAPKGLTFTAAPDICQHYGIHYHCVVHNDESTADIIRGYNLDVGVILGARILKKHIIDAFNVGVINMHPGILPQNRGLDNIKWSILKGYPVGVTAHLIDKHIDKGRLIVQKCIPVYHDDTLMDLLLRNQNLEQQLMLQAIATLKTWPDDELTPLGEGNYYKAVPPELEATIPEKFEEWKAIYAV